MQAFSEFPQDPQPASFRKSKLIIIAIVVAAIFVLYLDRDEAKPKVPKCKTTESCQDIALTLFRNGQFDSAEELLKKAISLSPEDPQAYIQLADVYKYQGHFVQAITQYEAARGILGPSKVDPKISRPLCEVYELERQPIKAWEVCKELYQGQEIRIGGTYPLAAISVMENRTAEEYLKSFNSWPFGPALSVKKYLDEIAKEIQQERYLKVVELADDYPHRNSGSVYAPLFLRYKMQALFALERYREIVDEFKDVDFTEGYSSEAQGVMEDLYAKSLSKKQEQPVQENFWQKTGIQDGFEGAKYLFWQRSKLWDVEDYSERVPIESLRKELHYIAALYKAHHWLEAHARHKKFVESASTNEDQVVRLFLRAKASLLIGLDPAKDWEKICADFSGHRLALKSHILLSHWYIEDYRYSEGYRHLKAILPLWMWIVNLLVQVFLIVLLYISFVYLLQVIFFKGKRILLKESGVGLNHLAGLLLLAFFLKPAVRILLMAIHYYDGNGIFSPHIQPFLTAELITETAMLGWVGFLVFKVYRWSIDDFGVVSKAGIKETVFDGLKILLCMLGATTVVVNLSQNGIFGDPYSFHDVGSVIYYMSLADRWQFLTVFVFFVIVTPLIEEFVFRGFLVRFLQLNLNGFWAVILSSLVYNAYHHASGFISLFLLLNGLILSEFYRRKSPIFSLVIAHALYNFFVLIFIYIRMSNPVVMGSH